MVKAKIFMVMMFYILFWTGCSVRVRQEYDKKTDFTKYNTYTWINDKGVNRNAEFARLIETAIAGQLAEKGYQKASGGEASFGVMYYGGVKGRVDVIDYDFSAWENEYGERGSKSPGHEEGTLVIEIVDLKTRLMVWRGRAGVFIDDSASTEEIVTNVVGKILEKFPPQ
jgi:hypothetical protein